MTKTTEFHWPLAVQEAIEQAKTGNQAAWATLYAAAATFTHDDAAIPAPLGSMMAERLQSISNVLSNPREKDKRAALPDAVLTAARRLQGRKAKAFPELMAEEVLLQALAYALPVDLLKEVAPMLEAMPEEALTFAARVTTSKHIDAAIAHMVDKKMTTIAENTLRANARKLRNTLKK